MDTEGLLQCTGRDGETRQFKYKCIPEQFSQSYSYHVYAIPPLDSGEFFELTVEDMENDALKITMMENHKIPEYSATGIPDALIPHIAKTFQKAVVSSSNGVRAGEFRTPDATKVWDRLVTNGMATKDEETDSYECSA